MPLVVVAAIAAGGAVAAGIVAASTVIYAGIAVSVVGKVTKSKELSQIGSGMSLGAGLASAATSIFGAAEAGTGAAAGAGEAATGAAGEAGALGGVDAAAGSLGATEGAEGVVSAAENTTAGLGNAGEAASGAAETGGGGLLNPQSSSALSSTPQASVAPGAPSIGGQAVSSTGDLANSAVGAGTVAPPVDTTSNGIAQWWSKQPESTKNRILQMGGQAVGSLFDGWTAEQKMALQREQMNLDKQKYDTSMANASAQPVVRFKSYTPPTGGLLNPTTKG